MKHIIEKHIGRDGRMVGYSKSGYLDRNPRNITVFNGNIVVEGKKEWYGDLDVTKDIKKLLALSNEIAKEVYILNEYDGRFDNEEKPDLSDPVIVLLKGEIKSLRGLGEYTEVFKGVPRRIRVIKKNQPKEDPYAEYKVSTDQYYEEDYIAVKIPMETFNGKVNDGCEVEDKDGDSINPLSQMNAYISKQVGGLEKAREMVQQGGIYWIAPSYVALQNKMRKYMRALGFSNKKIDKEIGWLAFGTPSLFQGIPSWAKKNTVYFLKPEAKERFFTENDVARENRLKALEEKS